MDPPAPRAISGLVVDDNEDERALVARELRRANALIQIREIACQSEFKAALGAGCFDLVITDYKLRWANGIEVLCAVKQKSPDCAVIMFTAAGSQEIAVEAMKLGLDDYVIKTPGHYARLPAAVATALKRRAERIDKRRADAGLRAALAEKDLLLKELYHRVKNNMQIISSLLDLQASTIRNAGMVETFRVSQARVRAMALVHEKLYQAPDLTKISFSDYVQDLVADLFSSYGVEPGRIELKLDVNLDGDFIPVDMAVPCGLIVNELLSNCVKHAFPEGRRGEIRVSLHAGEDDIYQLAVADNGVGLPAGFDNAVGSLGLSLVRSLSREQLKGTVEVKHNGGACFRICFPLRHRNKQ